MVVYVGWLYGDIISFITATTLARHKEKTKAVDPVPFMFKDSVLEAVMDRRGFYYAIGCFNENDIDELVGAGVKTTIIGRVYGRRYNGVGKHRAGNVIVYSVPRSSRLDGYEYLGVLMTYFGVSDESVFFTVLHKRRNVLAKILSVTKTWIPAYELFTTFEVVDKPTLDDVDRVIRYLAERYGYEEGFTAMREKLLSGTVGSNTRYAIIDIGEERDPEAYVPILRDVFPRPRTIALVSRYRDKYKIYVVCKEYYNNLKTEIKNALGGELREEYTGFTVQVPIHKPTRELHRILAQVFSQDNTCSRRTSIRT